MKKHRWTMLLISGLVALFIVSRPPDTRLYTLDYRYALSVGDAFEVPFIHPEPSHPWLHEESLLGARITGDDQAITLHIEAVEAAGSFGDYAVTMITFSWPFDAVKTPYFVDGDLTLRLLNGETVRFSGLQIGLFAASPFDDLSVQSMYGIFQDRQFEGLYLTLKNQTDAPVTLQSVDLGFSELVADAVQLKKTTDAFTHSQAFSAYDVRPLYGFEPLETQTIIIPFEPATSLQAAPVCLTYTLQTDTRQSCLAPFQFIDRSFSSADFIPGITND